eukprot:TRINITY_DN10477_c0_g1_i1.p1 TRINITY_DN10477_c0_g1~~TRINITY_DN10477_c0_g1_i1.p1  ORF type:complete len:257 (-),score=65.78 TRINITY_DN10477_c0_g1_i1:81-851(-)
MSKEVFIQNDFNNVALQGKLWCNEENKESEIGVLITHPHPKLGGSMDDHVVKSVFNYFTTKNEINTVIRFNFRGIGKSSGGSSWFATQEIEDVKAVYNYLMEREGVKKVLFVGYSFGSVVIQSAPNAIQSDNILGCIAISYPYSFWSSFLFNHHYKICKENNQLPKLFVMGDSDGFLNENNFNKWFDTLIGDKNKKHIIPNCSHFWLDNAYKQEMTSVIDEWFFETILKSDNNNNDYQSNNTNDDSNNNLDNNNNE